MACSCRWVQRWVLMSSCLPLELKVWRSHADSKQRICSQAQSQTHKKTQYCAMYRWLKYQPQLIVPCHFSSLAQLLLFFFSYSNSIILFLPLLVSIPSPSLSVCVSPLCVQYDYVTKQKSPIRMFIGGAHLWLVLHNCSHLILMLTWFKIDTLVKWKPQNSMNICTHCFLTSPAKKHYVGGGSW